MPKSALSFYKKFFSICILLVLQNILALSVNLADNIMLGAYSEPALSGVTAVNQIQFLFQQMLNAVGDGVVILGSQYWGKKDMVSIKKIAAIAMRAAIMIAVILFLCVSIFPHSVLHLFTTEEGIIGEGMKYLAIIRFTYVLFAVTTILLITLRTVESVKIAFCLSVSTLFINCCINYVLIYGRFGAPQMGAAGAAIGTLTARFMECICIISYVLKREGVLKLRLRDYLHLDTNLKRDYIKVTFPLFCIQSMWGVNTALQTAILGHMTARAIAANSAASNLFLLVKSAAVGAASAASVIIGKTVGEGSEITARLYARRLQILFVFIGLASGSVLYFLRTPVLGLYALSEDAYKLADTFLVILSVICVGMSYQMPANDGIIKGGGDAMFVVKMNLISIWGIVIPLSALMAFVFHASPAVVVWCLNSDQIFKCIPAFLKVNYGSWIKKLTR